MLTQQMIVNLISNPSRENYLAIWEVLTSAEGYNPYNDDITQLNELIGKGRFADALTQGQPLLMRWFLSPRVHLLMARANHELGKEQAASMEGAIARACAEAILATGDGSVDHPYLVTRTSDEYDVLLYLSKEKSGQDLAHLGGRSLDRLHCPDGTTLHFDITRVYAALTTRMNRSS